MSLDDFLVGLASGALVAALQLVAVYFLIERYLAKAEDRKWKAARLELSAGVLTFSQSVARPLAHYMHIEDGGVFPRENIPAALDHIQDVSRRFDSFVAIYAIGIPADWLALLSRYADDLRHVAVAADIARKNWALFEKELPSRTEVQAGDVRRFLFQGVGRVVSTNYELPADPSARVRTLFCFSIVQCCEDIANLASALKSFAFSRYSTSEINKTIFYQRMDKRWGFDAESDMRGVDYDIQHLERVVDAADRQGIFLMKEEEFAGAMLAEVARPPQA